MSGDDDGGENISLELIRLHTEIPEFYRNQWQRIQIGNGWCGQGLTTRS